MNGEIVDFIPMMPSHTAGELTVESLLIVEHGYTLRGSQNYGSGKDVFKKAAP